VSALIGVICVIRHSVNGAIWLLINAYILVCALIHDVCNKAFTQKRHLIDFNIHILVSALIRVMCVIIPFVPVSP